MREEEGGGDGGHRVCESLNSRERSPGEPAGTRWGHKSSILTVMYPNERATRLRTRLASFYPFIFPSFFLFLSPALVLGLDGEGRSLGGGRIWSNYKVTSPGLAMGRCIIITHHYYIFLE